MKKYDALRRKSTKVMAVKEQIKKRRISFLMIEGGLREFTIDLGLKVLIANLWVFVNGERTWVSSRI